MKNAMNRQILAKNLKHIRDNLNLTQPEFAKPLGITGSYISDLERGKSDLSDPILILLEIIYRVNREWLFTGEGEPYINGITLRDETLFFNAKDEPISEHAQDVSLSLAAITEEQAAAIRAEGAVGELLSMTREILTSETIYADSLSVNIKAFHHAVKSEKEKKEDLRKGLKEEIKEEIKGQLHEYISREDAPRLRATDGPEVKIEEIFLKRSPQNHAANIKEKETIITTV